jgi:nucleotide-binding universal stress UspA family protein
VEARMAELRKVLCPVDLSPDAGSAASEAASLAEALGAELVLLHVMAETALAFGDPLLAPGEVSQFSVPVLGEDYYKEMDKRLTGLGDKLRTGGLNVSTLLLRGTPHEAIVHAADDAHADLIVMGTHGRSGLSHLLLGSVTERVVRTAKVPVMTLRLH